MINLKVQQYHNKIKWLIFLIVFIPSCKKEYCWECTRTIGHSNGPMYPMVYTKSYEEYCHKTENEIAIIMQDAYRPRGNSSVTLACNKQ